VRKEVEGRSKAELEREKAKIGDETEQDVAGEQLKDYLRAGGRNRKRIVAETFEGALSGRIRKG